MRNMLQFIRAVLLTITVMLWVFVVTEVAMGIYFRSWNDILMAAMVGCVAYGMTRDFFKDDSEINGS